MADNELRTATELDGTAGFELAPDDLMPLTKAAGGSGLFRTKLATLKAFFLAGASGVPDGGTTGQVLGKISDADGDAGWIDQTGGGGGGGDIPSSAITAKQWRFRVLQLPGGAAHWGTSEVQWLDKDANNLCVGGTPSSASVYDPARGLAQAFDGNLDQNSSNGYGSGSTSDSATNEFIAYTFSAPVTPQTLNLFPISGGYFSNPTAVAIEYRNSDADPWTILIDNVEVPSVTQGTPAQILVQDLSVSVSYVTEAPDDGTAYVRKNKTWVVESEGGSGGSSSFSHKVMLSGGINTFTFNDAEIANFNTLQIEVIGRCTASGNAVVGVRINGDATASHSLQRYFMHATGMTQTSRSGMTSIEDVFFVAGTECVDPKRRAQNIATIQGCRDANYKYIDGTGQITYNGGQDVYTVHGWGEFPSSNPVTSVTLLIIGDGNFTEDSYAIIRGLP